ncbi:TPA: oligosaccharide flippase family protein [Bacillus mobilis]|nr:oligosaccharide flippase family protein [Bacillus mobilis]
MKNVVTLMSGTVFAQFIAMALSPILTRLYTPEEYGVFSFYVTIVSLLSVVATGRYEMAIILPKKENNAINIVFICMMITSMISIFCLVMSNIFYNSLNVMFHGEFLAEYLILIPVFVFFTGCYQTYYYWSNRQKDYKTMSLSRVVQSFTNTFGGIGLGVLGSGALGLILSQVLGLILSVMYLLFKVKNLNIKGFKSALNRRKIRENLYQYKDFPLYNSFHALLDMGLSSGLFFLIGYYYGNMVLGYYAFTWRVLKAPLSIIGTAISQVYVQRANEYYQQGLNVTSLLMSIIKKLTMLALPIFLIIFIWGEELFRIVFGAEWGETGKIAELLTPWLFLNFIASPIAQTYVIFNRQKKALVFAIFQTTLFLVSVMVMGNFNVDATILFRVVSVIGSVTTIIFGLWIFLIAKENDRESLR